MERLNKKTIAGFVFVLILLAAAALAWLKVEPRKQPKIPPAQTAGTTMDPALTEGAFSFGPAEAKVTIIEFSDFECPYCKRSHSTIRQLGYRYKDAVKIVFKDYPAHKNSLTLALAARCAGEQNAFWAMHDKLFSRQGEFDLSELPKMAAEIGIDTKSFNGCLASKKYEAAIIKDFQDGERLAIKGTPTFLINGQMVAGDKPMEFWEQIIQFILKNEK